MYQIKKDGSQDMEDNKDQEKEKLGLSDEELEAEEGTELPDREAMSLVTPQQPFPFTGIDPVMDPQPPLYHTLPVEPPQ
jgi:hypothetical protein